MSVSVIRLMPAQYSIKVNPQNKAIQVYKDIPNMCDDEMLYTFNLDGSATARSCAWGSRSECPVGTFSDLLLKLPSADKLNSKNAADLVRTYDNYCQKSRASYRK